MYIVACFYCETSFLLFLIITRFLYNVILLAPDDVYHDLYFQDVVKEYTATTKMLGKVLKMQTFPTYRIAFS